LDLWVSLGYPETPVQQASAWNADAPEALSLRTFIDASGLAGAPLSLSFRSLGFKAK